MFAWLSTGTELRRFSKGVLPRLAVLVMLFIPLLYGVLYLWAFWDPVGNMNHLPVALVNEDVGTTVNGEHENFGDQVVKKLDDRQDLKWKRTSASAASDGVKDGTYYFSVTLPKAFSRQAVSPSTSTPTSPQIMVRYNDSNSFLASTLGKEAMSQVRAAVAQQFGTKYAKTALVGLQSARGGLVQAADGSGQITDGLTTAQAGTQQLNVGLGTLTDGMAQLSSGSSTLSASTKQLAAGAAKLDGGAQSLAAGATSANAGAQQLSSGASQAVSGIGQLQQGSTTLNSGNQQLAAGLNSLYTGITVPQSGQSASLADGTKSLAARLGQLQGKTDELGDNVSQLNAGTQTLVGSTNETVAKLQKMSTELQAAQATATAHGDAATAAILSGVNDELDQQLAVATSAENVQLITQLSDWMNALDVAVNQGADGQPSLRAAIGSAASGASTVNTAINSQDPQHPGVVAAVGALQDGAKKAADGSAQLLSLIHI